MKSLTGVTCTIQCVSQKADQKINNDEINQKQTTSQSQKLRHKINT